MHEPRPFQYEAVEAFFSEYQKGIDKQLIVLATGMGKTFVAGYIIKQLKDRISGSGRVLWITHEENLIDQSAVSVMSTLYPENGNAIKIMVGESGGIVDFMTGNHDLFAHPESADTYYLLKENLGIIKQKLFNISPRIVVASVQTIVNRLDKIPADHFDLIIVDEAHLALAKQWSVVLDYFNPKVRLGLTATPERLDGLSLGDLFDKIVIERDIKFGIENEYLCELEAITLSTGLSLDEVRTTAGDLNQKDLKIVDCPERNNKIVDAWLQYAESPLFPGVYRTTQAFCVDIEHAQHLCSAFIEKGCKATFISGSAEKVSGYTQSQWEEEVKNRIKGWKSREYDIMCVVNLLVIGFDFPDVACTIPASPTKSKTRFLQGPVGRGTRNKSAWFRQTFGKNNCIIIDPTDNSKKHSVVNTYSLENGKRIEDRIFIGRERKAALIDQRDKRKLSHTQGRDERVSLMSLPVVEISMDAAWMKEDATEKQLAFIGKNGWDIINNRYTKGQCAEIIGSFEAYDSYKAYLTRFGYDVSGGCTLAQYGLAKQHIEARLLKELVEKSPAFKNSPFIGMA